MASKGIADIIPGNVPFPLELRVIKRFSPYTGGKENKQKYMLLVDEKGDAIEARYDLNDTRFDRMKVDACYQITGHISTPARTSGKVVYHNASLLLAKRAVVDSIAEKPIPRFYYKFATYEMLASRQKDKNRLLTDYLGLIEKTTNVFKQKTYNLLKITLLDQQGKTVMVTLWENIACAFKTENIVGKVLAISSPKVTNHYDMLQLESTDVITLTVDPPLEDLQAITARLKHLQANRRTDPALQLALSNCETGLTISQLRMKLPDEFRNKKYTVQARIMEFEDYRGWYKAKCTEPNCNAQLYKEGGNLICPQEHNFESAIYTYGVNGTIVDETDTLPVVFFNEEMHQMLGISCRSMVVDKGFDNSKEIPGPMLSFVGKSLNFTVRLRYNNSAVVVAATSTEENDPLNNQQLLLPSTAPNTPTKNTTRGNAGDFQGAGPTKRQKTKQ